MTRVQEASFYAQHSHSDYVCSPDMVWSYISINWEAESVFV
jgi:hypothetical protein